MEKKELGKLFFCGFSNGFNENAVEKIRKHNLGGILLSSSNMKDSFTLANTMKHIASLRKEGLDFLISSDNEGGQVHTLPNVPSVSGNLAMGFSNNEENAYGYAKMSGTIMKAIGLNAVFAPVMDLYYEGNSPVVGLRTFGSDKEAVAKLGVATVKGYTESGMLSCAKHFPGHGRATLDSHLQLPTVDASFEELLETDLYPFEKVVKAGIPAVMSAHIVYPQIDNKPATLSEKFLTGVLRERFGHEGLIISDAIEMKAIWDNYSTEEVLKGFFNSGGDMIILTTVGANIEQYIDTLYDLVNKGEVSEEKIRKSIKRVENAMNRFTAEDTGFLYDIAKDAVETNVKELTKTSNIVISLPMPSNMSLADTSAKSYAMIEEKAKEIFDLKSTITYPLDAKEKISFEDVPTKNDLVIDIVIDSFRNENLMEYHRKLKEKSGDVVYIIARDPADYKLYKESSNIVTRSTDIISITIAMEEIKKRII